MIDMKNTFLVVSMLLLLTACGGNQQKSNQGASELIHLNCLEAKAAKLEAPLLSTLVSEIRYVHLELHDKALLKNFDNIVLTDKYIIVESGVDLIGTVAFDKETGKYVRTIGMKGDQGPEGYQHATYPVYVNGGEVLMRGWNNEHFNAYSLETGKLTRKLPGVNGPWIERPEYVYPLNDSTLMFYTSNWQGTQDYGLQVQTYSGRRIKQFPSTNNYKHEAYWWNLFPNEMIFYGYEEDICFHEFTSDTIFSLTDKLDAAPRYVLGLGEKLPDQQYIHNERDFERERFIKPDRIVETDRYLVVSCLIWSKELFVYDKQEQKTIYMDGDGMGFVNDLDGFLPIVPVSRGRGVAANEMLATFSAEEYLDAVEATGKNPLGKELEFDDNPVVVILKE